MTYLPPRSGLGLPTREFGLFEYLRAGENSLGNRFLACLSDGNSTSLFIHLPHQISGARATQLQCYSDAIERKFLYGNVLSKAQQYLLQWRVHTQQCQLQNGTKKDDANWYPYDPLTLISFNASLNTITLPFEIPLSIVPFNLGACHSLPPYLRIPQVPLMLRPLNTSAQLSPSGPP
jgi:hypothetical protein